MTLYNAILGEGKFSVVFKATKLSDNTPVALKLLKVQFNFKNILDI